MVFYFSSWSLSRAVWQFLWFLSNVNFAPQWKSCVLSSVYGSNVQEGPKKKENNESGAVLREMKGYDEKLRRAEACEAGTVGSQIAWLLTGCRTHQKQPIKPQKRHIKHKNHWLSDVLSTHQGCEKWKKVSSSSPLGNTPHMLHRLRSQ